jgi:hypothetical protein
MSVIHQSHLIHLKFFPGIVNIINLFNYSIYDENNMNRSLNKHCVEKTNTFDEH